MLNVENSDSFISSTGVVSKEFRTQLGIGLQVKLQPLFSTIDQGMIALESAGVVPPRIAQIGRDQRGELASFLSNFISSDSVIVFEELPLDEGATAQPQILMSEEKQAPSLKEGSSHIDGRTALALSEIFRHQFNTAMTPIKLLRRPAADLHPDSLSDFDAVQQAASQIADIINNFENPEEITTAATEEGIDINVTPKQPTIPHDIFVAEQVQAA